MVPVVAHDIIGRLMIQCARQPGLAYVFSHIFEFDGNEIYIKEWPELVGKHFRDALFRFEDASIILELLIIFFFRDNAFKSDQE